MGERHWALGMWCTFAASDRWVITDDGRGGVWGMKGVRFTGG